MYHNKTAQFGKCIVMWEWNDGINILHGGGGGGQWMLTKKKKRGD